MQSYNEFIAEAKLSRVISHFSKSGYPVGIMTAFRGEVPERQNISNNTRLSADVRKAGFGFVWVEGHWIENKGTADELDVSETSLIIIGDKNTEPGELDGFLQIQCKKYNQDGYVFKDREANTYVKDKSGNVIVGPFSSFSFERVEAGYTRLKKGNPKARTFAFESAYYPNTGIINRMNAAKNVNRTDRKT